MVLSKLQIILDRQSWRPIMRPTSGADLAENSLQLKELDGLEGVGRLGFRIERSARLELTAGFYAVEFASRYRTEVYPRRWRKWLRRLKITLRNGLTASRAAVECAASVEPLVRIETFFNN